MERGSVLANFFTAKFIPDLSHIKKAESCEGNDSGFVTRMIEILHSVFKNPYYTKFKGHEVTSLVL